MKVRGSGGIVIDGRGYARGDTIPWKMVYPGLLIHMFLFGGSGVYLAYFVRYPEPVFAVMWGGFGIAIYLLPEPVNPGETDGGSKLVSGLLGLGREIRSPVPRSGSAQN